MSTLVPGQRLGPYEVVSPLGVGGMGEVYQALDTRLSRTIAIKVARENFSERFEREARAVAALNHPNICTLHDVGPDYLVMELVEGPTLAERIAEGAIPVDEALRIARQIADALEAAHEQGIVHRDLKPANIKVKPDGLVKVLDFGLAKVGGAVAAPSGVDSPTISMTATQAGVILGTASYMAPEQARGTVVDKRADIWAFGVVLYEMITGRRLFEGEDVTETLAKVIKGEPKWDDVPANVQRLLKSCLEKDPKRRLRDIGDAWRPLEEAPAAALRASSRLSVAPAAAAVLFGLAFGILAFFHFREQPPAAEVARFHIFPPENKSFTGSDMLLSPDGRKLAFQVSLPDGRAQLWVRSLDSVEARPLAGTEGVSLTNFWSPDSRLLGFAVQGKLKKIDVSNGPPQTLCDLPGTWLGGTWSRDGMIVIGARGSGLWRVPEAGGAPSPLTRADVSRKEAFHSNPEFLPDGRHFLYTRQGGEGAGIYVGSLDALPEQQSSTRLLPNSSAAVYAPASGQDSGIGYLLFIREPSLVAQAFDVRRQQLAGEPEPIAQGVATPRPFSASTTGLLAYRTGALGGTIANTQLTWFDRRGQGLGTVGEPGIYNSVALSPDGTRAAVSLAQAITPGVQLYDIWVYEFARGIGNRLTSDPGVDLFATWSPDGSRIIFSSNRNGTVQNLYQKAASGAGIDELLHKSDEQKYSQDWSRDGKFLLYSVAVSGNDSIQDLWVLPLTPGGKPEPYLNSEFNEGQGRFSPDGRYVAYRSDASGRDEIYVQPFPSAAGGKWAVSQGGGLAPRWRADGKELFYLSSDSKMMAVEVTTNPVFKAGIPKVLFQTSILGTSRNTTRYDVSADGMKFLMNSAIAAPATLPSPITVVLNWQAMLKKPTP